MQVRPSSVDDGRDGSIGSLDVAEPPQSLFNSGSQHGPPHPLRSHTGRGGQSRRTTRRLFDHNRVAGRSNEATKKRSDDEGAEDPEGR